MKLGQEHHIHSNKCLSCGKKLDMATCIDSDSRPSEGDITICIQCGHIMAFSFDLSFRELTDDEMGVIAGDKRILAIQKARKLSTE